MELHIGLEGTALACCMALVGAGCAMSARPAVVEHAADAAPASVSWRLSVSPGDDGTYRIHVADADGRELQVLDGPYRRPPHDASELVRLDDFTGDGRPDILARGASAGASALTSETIYVYDAASGRFLDADAFENEGEVSTTSPGCIAVEHRNADNMTYSRDAYCWDGAWVRKGGAR